MTLSSITHIHEHRLLECEFIPPLDYRDSWTMPWEQHLAVTTAWQEAGGNRDGEACQWSIEDGAAAFPVFERRKHVLIIDFPDRRMAA